MTFKDQATADLSTFLNVDEFADTVEIDGVAVACVLDGDEKPADFEGVAAQETILRCRASDFEVQPVVRQRITVDERQADVIDVDEQQGLLVLKLRWYDS